MSDNIKPEDLPAFVGEVLHSYGRQVTEKINAAGRESMNRLVKRTKETAPRGLRATRNFAGSISSKEEENGLTGSRRYIWYVKPPNYRLTHLLVHGHATKNGGRTKPNQFLKNALDEVLPEYERAVEEAIKNGNN